MFPRLARGLIVLQWLTSVQGAEPESDRLKRHVTTLASPEFAGRRDEGAVKARDYLVDEFRRLKLAPLFGESFRQDVTGGNPRRILGVNVGAKLAATDPNADEWIILGVHFDHLGMRGNVIYPGADDNASSVAMMLEVARSMVESPSTLRRGVMFVGFDLEEMGPQGEFGLRGSQFFVQNPPVPLGQVRLFVTADMIGRSLGGVCRPDVFVLGSEREPAVRPWIAQGSEGRPVRVNLMGSDVLVVDRSDYGPFRIKEIPYLFFTTGESEVYHSPNDLAATIDYEKLAAISQIMARVIQSAAQAESVPPWLAIPDYPLSEATSFRNVFQTLLDHRDDLKIKPFGIALIKQGVELADRVIAQGNMTTAERSAIVRIAQIVLTTVL